MRERGVSISNDYLKLFDNLTKDALTKDEIKIFKDKRTAEKEYNKASLENDYAKKIQYLNNAIQLDNTKYEYYSLLAYCYRVQKDYQKALEIYNIALTLNTQSSTLFNSVAFLYIDMNEDDKALQEFNKSIVNSNDITAFLSKAMIYKRQKKYVEAMEIYNYVINLLPDSDSALNNRADLLRILGNSKEAYIDVYKAIEINPDSSVYFGTLAEIYALEGKLEEFYLNLVIALSKGLDAKTMKTANDVYMKFIKEEKFINLMKKYKIEIDEFSQEEPTS